MELIENLITRLFSLGPEALVVVLILVTGLALKKSPIPNVWIPAIVVPLGVAVYPFLASDGRMPHTLELSTNGMVVAKLTYAMILSFGTWALHHYILKHAERFIPGLKKEDEKE